MPKPSFAVLLLATTMLVAACGGGGNECCDPFEQSDVAKSAPSGDAQAGTVGQVLPLPLQVVVTTGGTPTPGITVNWSTAAAGGAVSPTSSDTDADGIASTTWTLGTTAGAQTATATVTGATGSPVIFSASAAAGAAATLEDASGNNQTGEINTALPQPLVAIATDEFGNAVAGVAVNWAATAATLSASSDVTDASGVSDVTVTLGGTPGPITITAASEGLDGSPLTFTATATDAAAIPTTAAVTVRDFDFVSVRNSTVPAVDTVAVGGSVTWTWAASVSGSHNITPDDPPSPSFTGRGTVAPSPLPEPFTVTFAAPGTYDYYCSLHGSLNSGMSGRIVVR
jgi:plastocyanin